MGCQQLFGDEINCSSPEDQEHHEAAGDIIDSASPAGCLVDTETQTTD